MCFWRCSRLPRGSDVLKFERSARILWFLCCVWEGCRLPWLLFLPCSPLGWCWLPEYVPRCMPSLGDAWGFVERSMRYHRVLLYQGVVCDIWRSVVWLYGFYRWRVFLRQEGRRSCWSVGRGGSPVHVGIGRLHSRPRALVCPLFCFRYQMRLSSVFIWLIKFFIMFLSSHRSIDGCSVFTVGVVSVFSCDVLCSPWVTWAYVKPAGIGLVWSVEVGCNGACLARSVGYIFCCYCLWMIHPLYFAGWGSLQFAHLTFSSGVFLEHSLVRWCCAHFTHRGVLRQ